MDRYTRVTIGSVLGALIITVSPCQAEMFQVALTEGAVVKNPDRVDVERDFVPIPVPPKLDSVYLDVAELVLTVATVCDATEPLWIAVFLSTVSPSLRSSTWSADWTPVTGGFDIRYGDLLPIRRSSAAKEIRIDITGLVQRWQAGESPNHGIVLNPSGRTGQPSVGFVTADTTEPTPGSRFTTLP